jgi:hypothetical protein
MFDRFWQQYPQGSILSELLQIHGENYIVRITLKSAEQTLVSTLAAADRIEVAFSGFGTRRHRQRDTSRPRVARSHSRGDVADFTRSRLRRSGARIYGQP